MNQKKKIESTSEPLVVAKTAIRRWGFWSVMLGTVFGAVAAAATLWVWEPVYEAKQFIRVIKDREFADVEQDRGSELDTKSFLAPIRSELLLSRLLANETVRKAAAGRKTELDVKQLQEMVKYEGGGELYAVVCTDESPQLAAAIAENLAYDFVEYHKIDRDESLETLKETLEEEIADQERVVQRISTELSVKNQDRMQADDNKPIDPDGFYYSEMLKNLYNEQLSKDNLTQEAQAVRVALENLDKDFDRSRVVSAVMNSASIRAYDERLASLGVERQKLSLAGVNHPQVKSIDYQIAEATKRREREIEVQYQLQKDESLRSQRQSMQTSLAECEKQIRLHDANITSYASEVDRLKGEMKRNNKIDFEFEQKLDEQRRAQDALADWIAKRNRIEAKNMSLQQVKIEGPENVLPPTTPVERYPIKLLGMAFLAGFGIPLALAFLWELRIERVSSFDQIEGNNRFKILGEVADLPVRSSRSNVLNSKRVTRQLRLYEESVDNLSALISHASNDLPVAFSVTSAASNEGKTTLASQLAISSAKSHIGKTLLIDADLRSPSVHRLFNASLDVGLCDVLIGTSPLRNAIQETKIDNLDVLTAGRIRTNPRRYFAGDEWEKLLNEAGAYYDHVIVDTPPVLAASESLAISRQCDYSLMCVMRDVSRADGVKRAHERLLGAGVNVIACAFSGVPQSEYASKYGSYDYNMS